MWQKVRIVIRCSGEPAVDSLFLGHQVELPVSHHSNDVLPIPGEFSYAFRAFENIRIIDWKMYFTTAVRAYAY